MAAPRQACQAAAVLEDGTYEAFVVDASLDVGPAGKALVLDLTILAGAHKGEVVSVRAGGLDLDEGDAIGMPATVVVRDGRPSVSLDTTI
jgi:hypothetical protein